MSVDDYHMNMVNRRVTDGDMPFAFNMDPIPQSPRNRKVEIKVEDLSSTTFKQWTDGTKWLCVTKPRQIDRPEGVGRMIGTIEDINEFIGSYPHPVGTFFVVCDLDNFMDLALQHPTRDLRLLLV